MDMMIKCEFFHKIVEKFLTVHALHGAAVMEKKGWLEYILCKVYRVSMNN